MFAWRWTGWRGVNRIAASLRLIGALRLLKLDTVLLSATEVALIALVALVALVAIVALVRRRVWRRWIILLLVVVIWLRSTCILGRAMARGSSTTCPSSAPIRGQVPTTASTGGDAAKTVSWLANGILGDQKDSRKHEEDKEGTDDDGGQDNPPSIAIPVIIAPIAVPVAVVRSIRTSTFRYSLAKTRFQPQIKLRRKNCRVTRAADARTDVDGNGSL